MTVQKIVRIVWKVFAKIEKSENCHFLVIFGLFLALLLKSQSYHFDAICTHRTLIWCRMTVKNFVRIVGTVFEKIEKSRKMAVLAIFGPISAVSHIPTIEF